MDILGDATSPSLDAAGVLADAAQAPRLHSLSITCVSCHASCAFSSLQRLARAPAPLRHLVISHGIKLSAAVVGALGMPRTLRSVKLDHWMLVGNSDEGAIASIAAQSEGGSVEIALLDTGLSKFVPTEWTS